MKYALCPICGRRYECQFITCGFCKVPEYIGSSGVPVRLWQVTQSERGAIYHPPNALAPRGNS